jgi:hypothetical protein
MLNLMALASAVPAIHFLDSEGHTTNAGEGIVQGTTDALTGVTGWFTSVFNSIGTLLYDSATHNLTVVGYLVCIPVAIGLVTFGIKFIMKLVSKIKA